jgi:hypothetical protein
MRKKWDYESCTCRGNVPGHHTVITTATTIALIATLHSCWSAPAEVHEHYGCRRGETSVACTAEGSLIHREHTCRECGRWISAAQTASGSKWRFARFFLWIRTGMQPPAMQVQPNTLALMRVGSETPPEHESIHLLCSLT